MLYYAEIIHRDISCRREKSVLHPLISSKSPKDPLCEQFRLRALKKESDTRQPEYLSDFISFEVLRLSHQLLKEDCLSALEHLHF